ncbi:hypothetical protein TVAG_430300 [Trichomonas vaginalis G3]|uniref:Uncharacterized protein n=1 Tax=Trichomonas vaginalis (strain ATCC PRA-98 / G3) TaxID=412133 RepID=A2E356_TRIV3|nr:hypothetical protein TVAG_430300 [Trichomonas vaginalis G3]|eukprot:XP_001325089.1 hypothetical protein [Trichomonas vaginalis G3]
MYKVGQGAARRADATQSITSNGDMQPFSYTIKNLASEQANQLTVWVAEFPDISYSNAPRYSVSEQKNVDYVISTPPSLQVTYPDKTIYEWNESIHLIINVNDDVSGKLVFQALEEVDPDFDGEPLLIDFEHKEVKYDHAETKTFDIRINLEKSAKIVLNITAIGDDGGDVSYTSYHFVVFNQPKITNVELKENVVSPGTEVGFNCTFTDSNNGHDVTLFYKFDNLQPKSIPHLDEDEKTIFSISDTFAVPNDAIGCPKVRLAQRSI